MTKMTPEAGSGNAPAIGETTGTAHIGTVSTEDRTVIFGVDPLQASLPDANTILMARAQIEIGESGKISDETTSLMTRNVLRLMGSLSDE
jgi:hypothetical protein